MTDMTAGLANFLATFGGVAGSVHLVRGDDLVMAAAVNLPEPVRAATAVVPRGKGMAGLAWERAEPVQTCNLKTDDTGDVRPGARAVAAQAAVALPVHGGDGVVAVVGIAFLGERELTAAEIDRFTSHATTVVHTGLARERATAWLRARQDESGSWSSSACLTALAADALGGDDRAVEWLVAQQNDDGSFGDGPDRRYHRPYATALVLRLLDRDRYSAQADAATGFLLRNQSADGGFGAGAIWPTAAGEITKEFPTLSQTAFAADALRGVAGDFWTSLVEYVRACQNDDGGFIAEPELPGTSTGVATAQGVQCLLAAGLPAESPEVVAGLDWLRRNLDVTQHARFADALDSGRRQRWSDGQTGLYLYLWALTGVLGERADVAEHLCAVQQGDGSWVNENATWPEFDAITSTAFALGTLNSAAARHGSL